MRSPTPARPTSLARPRISIAFEFHDRTIRGEVTENTTDGIVEYSRDGGEHRIVSSPHEVPYVYEVRMCVPSDLAEKSIHWSRRNGRYPRPAWIRIDGDADLPTEITLLVVFASDERQTCRFDLELASGGAEGLKASIDPTIVNNPENLDGAP